MSKAPKQLIKEYFNFSQKDRNAVITLAIIIILVLIGHLTVDNINSKAYIDNSEFEFAMHAREYTSQKDTNQQKKLFKFDPNTISGEKLDSLFIPFIIKKNLLSYRSAGGKFYKPSDICKIYGMNDSIYSIIEDLIKISDRSSKPFTPESKKNQETQIETYTANSDTSVLLFELNSADSLQLINLRGIGPVFASRIIKYRDLLGGFYSDDQLMEVYNFPEETFFAIRENITIDTTNIKKLRINFSDYIELIRHPYLNKKEVMNILSYREKNGAFTSISQIFYFGLVDSLKFDKIKPYLNCR